MNTSKKAAVFILLGQSNAVGHGVPMVEEDKITTPLKNVFGLHRRDNQKLHPKELIWSGYTSGGMNLAEEQDHTYSVVNCIAAQWQKRIDNGEELPDLYIIQIAVGAQGVTRNYMWYPYRQEICVPGVLGQVNISMFPMAVSVFSLLKESFAKMGKAFEIIGLHWRGGSNDISEDMDYLKTNLMSLYQKILFTFSDILDHPPIVLHEIHAPDRMKDLDPTGAYLERMYYINSVFEELAKTKENILLFDPRKAPSFRPGLRGNGLYIEDNIHFTPEVNRWVAHSIIDDYCLRCDKADD